MLSKEDLSKIRRLEIVTRRKVDDLTGGAYRSLFRGRGIEFSEVREYTTNDDVRDIDWNVTARTGVPFVKKYVEERELNVVIAVDMSASCDFGSVSQEKRERMAETATLLALSAERNHDKTGLLLFSNRQELFLQPRSGRKHCLRLIRELLCFKPQSKGTDLSAAFTYLTKFLKKRSILFFISDFLSDSPYLRELKIIAKKHDTVLVRVTDPLEVSFPPCPALNLQDAETGERITFSANRSNTALLNTITASQTQQLKANALQADAGFVDIGANDDPADRLAAYFRQCQPQRHGRRSAPGRTTP